MADPLGTLLEVTTVDLQQNVLAVLVPAHFAVNLQQLSCCNLNRRMCCNLTVYSSVQLQQNLLEPKLPAHFAVNLQYIVCCNLTAESPVNAIS